MSDLVRGLRGLLDAIRSNTSAGNTKLDNLHAQVDALAYEELRREVIDAIGQEHLRLFLDFSEADAPYTDRSGGGVRFLKHAAASRSNEGPWGRSVTLGEDDAIVQAPHTSHASGSTVPAYAPKLATFLQPQRVVATLATLRLRVVGSLPAARVRVQLYRDAGGAPGEPFWPNQGALFEDATVNLPALDASAIQSGRDAGFSLPPTYLVNEAAWLVLEYADATGVDEGNYVAWEHSTTGSYSQGGKRATFDGSNWSVTSGQDHRFGLYDAGLAFDEDFTLLVAVQSTKENGHLLGVPVATPGGSNGGVDLLSLAFEGPVIAVRYHDPAVGVQSDRYLPPATAHGDWPVLGLRFRRWESHKKVELLYNGRHAHMLARSTDGKTSLFGSAGSPFAGACQPWSIGRVLRPNGLHTGALFQGHIGPVIFADRALSDAEVAHVTNLIRNGR